MAPIFKFPLFDVVQLKIYFLNYRQVQKDTKKHTTDLNGMRISSIYIEDVRSNIRPQSTRERIASYCV